METKYCKHAVVYETENGDAEVVCCKLFHTDCLVSDARHCRLFDYREEVI